MKLHSSRRPAAAHARPASLVDDVRGAAVVLLDPAGHIVGWSEAAHIVLGYPAAEIVGRHLSALYERGGHEHTAEEALRVADQSGSYTDFGPLVSKGGATVLAQRTIHALGDGHGLVRGYSAMVVPQDPRAPSLARAEIERAVARARAAEGRATRILESVTDAFYSVDARWRFTYLNPVARRMIAQLHSGEPLGKTLWEVVPILTGTRAEDEYRLAVQEQRARHFTQDFADRCFEMHVYPSPDGLSVYFRDVTEDHRVQARLRTLESVVTQANDAVLITEAEPLDEPGPRIVYANDSFTRMTGYQPEEYLGKSPRFLQGAATDPKVTHQIRLALDRREPVTVELVNYRKDGTPFLVELIINPVFDDKRALKHFTAVQRDITERREAEQVALRLAREESARALAEDAQRRIGAILESITDAFFAVDTEWRFTYVNQRAEEFLGSRREELLGKSLWDILPDTWQSHVGQELRAAFSEQTKREFEASSRANDRWLEVRAYPSPTALSVYIADATERRRAEAAVRTRERLLSTIFEILPVGLCIADRAGRLVQTNPAGLRMWGGRPPETVAQRNEPGAWDAETGEPVPPDERPLSRALERGEATIGRMLRVEVASGQARIVITSAMPLADERGERAGAVAVEEDVTALKESEEAARRAVQARDDVLGIVAHDLRNPLNAMTMQLQRLGRRALSEKELGDAVEMMRKQSRRMNRLIQDLLDVARIEAGALALQCAPVRVADVLTEVVAAQRSIAGDSGIDLRLHAPEELPPVLADRDRLVQVLDNLVMNALKFTGPKGAIAISARLNGPEVLFSVADSGAGISPDQASHLFDRFWQAKHGDRRGAGLGLAIVKGIVEAHGGRIWVESVVGRGTAFYFTLPIAA